MKKSLLLSVALIAATSMMAQENATGLKMHPTRAAEMLSKRTEAVAAPASRVVDQPAITETPAGKLIDDLTLSCYALYPNAFEIYARNVSGKVSAIVEGEDGCLYVKNPVAVYPTDSWLKLDHVEGTTYVAHLPQTATTPWEFEGETVRMNFDRLDLNEDEFYYYPSFGESELTFNYENGVLTSTGVFGERSEFPVLLGLTFDIYGPDDADEAWAWYGVNDITVAPMTAAPGALPAGLTAETKVMISAQGESKVSMAIDGDDCYLSPVAGFGYAKGTIADGKIVFENGQYLGVSQGAHCYLMGGKVVVIEDEDFPEDSYTTVQRADNLTFDYDASTGAMISEYGVLVINEGNEAFYIQQMFVSPSIEAYNPVEGAPKNPSIIRYDEYDDWEEYGVLVVDLPAETADGTPISKADLYYNIFVKGSEEPYTFPGLMYELVGYDLTNIPYDFTDGGFDFSVDGTRHTIVIYEDLGAVGVQTVNTAGDKTFKSDIVWTDGSQSGIKDITATPAEGETLLYDLLGRPVSDPKAGLYIRRQGNRTEKIVVR